MPETGVGGNSLAKNDCVAGKPKTAEMHPGPGFRIRAEIERADPETVAGLAAFDTPAISDLMNRLYTMIPAIHPLTNPELPVLGPACTVKCFPGDNLMVHKSLDLARPGDVLVIDTSASSLTAVVGDLISTKARHRGIAGFVVDGLIRDLPEIRALGDFPVFARGVTPIGPLHRGPGEINHPVCAGGIVVHPGDVIVGDANGVVVVPRGVAAELLDRLRKRSALEADYRAAVARGDFSNVWVDQILEQQGVAMDGRPPPLGDPPGLAPEPAEDTPS
jgi:regulator of RNase E activity RraA